MRFIYYSNFFSYEYILENSDETFIPLGTSPPLEGLGEAPFLFL
ncbi:hypothetical protein HMPREF0973_02629 [Prevotella veroralis F0319]|uniref:Uncharacterized protein n=1 Tax=Prevotella veroralis F0319 TaxID=649761 RepID=C9MSL0_9BACT|nr:hypothetical protein HMPREF0973_02629 [Prevotella veroralis F0319]